METVVGALLPIVVTLLLGYFAGWHHDFGADQAAVLNRMVMLYALPLSLFTGILSTNRSALTSDVGLVGAIAAAMIVPYAIAFLVARYAFRIDPGRAALIALAIGVPAVPFVGTTVLGYLFGGSTAAILVTAAALPMNLVLVPVSLVVLAAGAPPTGPGQRDRGLRDHVVSTLREPVVWAPIAAIVLVLAGVSLPSVLKNSLGLLGQTTGAVALFASGIVLFAQKVAFTRAVGAIVLARNVLVPAALWGALVALGATSHVVRESVVTLAIPTASIAVILAVQYKTDEREMASSLLFSTLLSVVTMSAFILLT